METRFKKNQKVRHIQGEQEIIIDDFEMKVPTKIIKSAFGDMPTPKGREEFTGQVWCIWLVDGKEKGNHFDQDKLVLA